MTRSARLRLRRRIVAASVLLLHTLVVAAAPLADATLGYAPLGEQSHIEAQGSTDCPPVHDHERCQVCRALTWSALLSPPAATAAAGAPNTRRITRTASILAGRPAGHSPHAPRAPPHA